MAWVLGLIGAAVAVAVIARALIRYSKAWRS